MIKFSIFIFFSILASFAAGQNNNSNTVKHDLFAYGIYLENLKITIPWYAEFEEISKYGHPKIDTLSKRRLIVKWDSVKILKGITVNLQYEPHKIIFGNGKRTKLLMLIGTIAPVDTANVKKYFEDYTGSRGALKNLKNGSVSTWIFNNCRVTLVNYTMRDKQNRSLLYFETPKK